MKKEPAAEKNYSSPEPEPVAPSPPAENPPPEKPDELPPDVDELRASFSEFKSVFPCKVGLGDDATWDAYQGAVRDGANPDIINNRAQVYAMTEQARIERSKDPERQRQFTLHAENWLRKGRYRDPPPTGAVLDQNGFIVEVDVDDGDGINSHDAAYYRFEEQVALAEEALARKQAGGRS
jgi:hypothetical protein